MNHQKKKLKLPYWGVIFKTMDTHPLYDNLSGYINTASGKKINLKAPEGDCICIEDIAIGLSNICHFGGQITPFFSVAQHSWLVCYLAPMHLKLAALLHDASEAYIGDVIKPLKNILGIAYMEIESRFMNVILGEFGIPKEYMLYIKEYDNLVLQMEFDYFFKGNKAAFDSLKLPITEAFPLIWDNATAAQQFLRAFKDHSGRNLNNP